MHFNIKRVEKVVLIYQAQKGKNGQNALFHLLQNAPTPALIYHDFLPTSTHAHNYITRSLDSLHPNEQVYMHFNIKRVEKVVLIWRKKAQKGKNGQNALFHLLQNAPTPALIYHDFLPTSTHAHNYITRSLDSLHPNEQVYMHFNIKRVEKVVLRRKKAKMGENALFHLLQNAPTPALIYHDFLPTSTHAHNYITRSLDSLHPNEQVYMHFNIKRVEKVVLRRKKAKMGKTHCFTCFKMRLHLR